MVTHPLPTPLTERIMRLTKAKAFWIESDPLSGGSRSQIEFPIEVGVFFGGSRSPRIGDSLSIKVASAGVRYLSKKMDFHHNDVWRLNLPTVRQGLGPYAKTLACFERAERPGVFRLTIVPKRSALADKLRKWTKVHGSVGFTRRTSGAKRYYGYF